jgi:rhamnosyltransferase
MTAPLPFAPDVASVTVAFNPDAARLAAQLTALQAQVSRLIVVDNGSSRPVRRDLEPLLPQAVLARTQWLSLEENQGLARGFNMGVREARAWGARFALLLDHDSIPAGGMVGHLVAAHLPGDGAERVAATGPRVHDERDDREFPFIRLAWPRNRHLRCASGEGTVACDFLISSGCLLSIEAFEAVGEFDETLFIDNVDLEWCFRARSRGYSLYGACGARLDHRLGDERLAILNRYEIVVHSPERLYYMTRNRLMLYWRGYMPLSWKVKDAVRGLAKCAATVALVRPRAEYARMTLRAFRDAAARRGGKLPA